MVSVKEEAHRKKLQVYNWNEKLTGEPCWLSDLHGLLLFNITCSFTSRILGEGVVDSTQKNIQRMVAFDQRNLLSPEILLRDSVSLIDQFLPETVQPLGAEISDFLMRRYRFSPDRLHQPVSPRIVIVVEVLRSRSMEYSSREEMVVGNGMEGNLIPPWKPISNSRRDWPFVPALAENEPSLYSKYTSQIRKLLHDLTYLLNVRNAFPTLPITDDDPLGLVEVPVEFALETFQQAVDGSCAICLQRFSSPGEAVAVELVRTPCAHIFHMRCITPWLPKNPTCPMCRFQL